MDRKQITSILAKPEKISKSKVLDDLKEYSLQPEESDKIARILSTPKTDILSDLPANEDSLGFKALIRTVSSIVISDSTQTPLTICIHGEWGSGKTSILKMIESQARLLDVHCIWLNAWNFETKADLISNVAEEIQREFELQEVHQRLHRSLDEWKASSLGFGFGNLVTNLLKNENSESGLIVFVDDIDRAFPEQIAMTIKSLKLILESPKCVFVLAMDMDIVAQSLESYYKHQNQSLFISSLSNVRSDVISIDQTEQNTIAKRFGHSYLEKLIQIRIEVPALTREAVNKYLKEIDIAPEVTEIINWAPDGEILNPRRLKRYINWLSITLQLIISLPMPPEVSNLTALRAMALRYDYPDIYDNLIHLHDPFGLDEELVNRLGFSEQSFKDYLDKLPLNELEEFNRFLNTMPMLDAKRRKE
ncbi:MAG: AAA family ATPase [Alphaproteobacteria bacterium]|nr:AAA family ATPase [Alphaproteobacteria bacterium]